MPLALATLVAVEGSSYQQPGARLLVDAEGRVLAGAVSGGCLEGDVAARAAAVCATGQARRLRYDLRADLETIWGFGAACDGIAHLLLEPLATWEWLAEAEAQRQRRLGGAVVTRLTATGGRSGLAPPGDGEENALASLVDAAERTGAPLLAPLAADESVLIDPLVAPIALHCVGAGRGAEALARIASALGWTVTILDHRPAMLDGLELPPGVRTVAVRGADGAADALAELPADARTAVALLSHIFDADAAWLSACLPLPLLYIGVLGSRRRGAQLLARVSAEYDARGTPLSPRLTQKVFAPIGLDLGGEDPAAIALAAVAEIEAVMHGRPAGFLRDRLSPIHMRTPTPTVLPPLAGAPAPPSPSCAWGASPT